MSDDAPRIVPAAKLLRRRPARLPAPLEPDRGMRSGWLERADDPRLTAVVMDAVARAGDLATGGSLQLGLLEDADMARLLARHRGDPARMEAAATGAGITVGRAEALADAWVVGGPVGVGLLTGGAAPVIDDDALDAATEAASRAGHAAERRPDHVRLHEGPHAPARLLLGGDRRWYLVGDRDPDPVLLGPPGAHPARALTGR
ncbi:MAG: hypothetical protein M0P31_00215 [Solirubrobacteraceae bacterium]|nr:hypothetical protein [Solirubrobacteraceae bacterium]